ncbi:GntR family transcriptional regulator [Crenalkalicoccus roseus]|uniref:GntR family transcriptional regulator n=1 Tax=Crenalkalicoccus roseus TaxID=1485588 RepID=UPI001080AA63|nr:GntR family transcriptional regulator [Crenalkalicoccus roseus]
MRVARDRDAAEAAAADRGSTRPRRPADTAARLYEVLRERVTAYRVPPGARLNEVEIARELGASRTPVREALNRLATEGLLSFEPNRGFRARELDTKEIFDLYEARRLLEVSGARLACERAPDASVEELRLFWEEVEGRCPTTASAAAGLVAADEEFHERLIALSGNAELPRLLRGLNARIHFVRWVDLDRVGRREGTYVEHRAILDALSRRDGEGCARLLAAHIERRREDIVEVVREGIVRLFVR